jgi:outer membrane protein assembly factor BamB
VAALRSPSAPVGIVLAALTLLLPGSMGAAALAQASSTWGEFQGGPAKTGASETGPKPAYRRAWEASVAPEGPGERFGLSAPVIAGDLALAVGPEQVVAVDVATGERSFTVERDLGPSVPGAVANVGASGAFVYTQGWGTGPPAASGETAQSPAPETPSDEPGASPGPGNDEGAVDSELAAFDVGSQRPLWPPVPLDGVSRTGVTVVGERAFVGLNAGSVIGVDLVDGTVAWRRDLGGQLVTSLAASDGLVFAGLQGDGETSPVLAAIDQATGEVRWRYEPTGTASIVSAPSVADSAVHAVFTGLSETSVVSVDAGTGEQIWSRGLGSAFDVAAPPVVAGGAVYVTDPRGQSRALDASSGEERWDFALNSIVLRTVPVLVGEHLLVPTVDGELAAIEVASGDLVWRGVADGSPIRAMAFTGDSIVAVRGGEETGFVALEHDPGGTLVREPSPTTLALGPMLGAMAVVTIPLLALVLLLGRVLASRMGPAFPDAVDRAAEAGSDDDDVPIRDPWEDDEDPTP